MAIPLVSIAVCTYNGEKHLVEQLDSIVNQSYGNLEIIVVDDGSKDNTIDLLNTYGSKYSNLKVYQNEINLGYAKNFERAISLCNGDYIALSDQDDIWNLDKIKTLVKEIDGCSLVYHDSAYIKESGESLNRSLSQSSGYIEGNNKRFVAYNNCVAGHAMLFNSVLKSQIIPIPNNIPHDHWIAYVALANGNVKFIKNLLVKYRQHSQSITDILSIRLDSDKKNRKLNKIKKIESHNLDRIGFINAINSFKGNTTEDHLFYNRLIKYLSKRDKKYFSLSLFIFLLINMNTLFHFYKKTFISKFFRIFNNSVGSKTRRLFL